MNLSRETLLDDFSTMLSDAEDLLKRAGNETGERAKDLRAQVEAKLLAAKLRLQELEGEATDRARAAARVTDAGAQTLHAGDCAGYPAGKADGHHLVNRSGAPASYLEVGNREEADTAHYPDDDIQYSDSGDAYQHKDGRPY